jgi:hypothetical protein
MRFARRGRAQGRGCERRIERAVHVLSGGHRSPRLGPVMGTRSPPSQVHACSIQHVTGQRKHKPLTAQLADGDGDADASARVCRFGAVKVLLHLCPKPQRDASAEEDAYTTERTGLGVRRV